MVVLICAAATQVFAFGGGPAMDGSPRHGLPPSGESFEAGKIPEAPGGPHREITDEEKAKMEAMMAEREEKLNAFIASLSEEQKAAFNELFDKPIGQGPAGHPHEMPDGEWNH